MRMRSLLTQQRPAPVERLHRRDSFTTASESS